MSDLGSTERRLLRALRAADEPSDDDRARVRSRLLVKLAASSGIASAIATAASAPGAATAAGTASVAAGTAGVAAGTASVAPGATAAAAAATGFFAGTWKVGTAIVALVGAASGTAWIASSSTTSEPAAMAPQTAKPADNKGAQPAAARQTSAESPETLAPSAAIPKSSRNQVQATEAPASASKEQGDLESELSLLENAQQALKQGDSERALKELDEHAAKHPGGTLARERAGIRAVALCESGKISEGQRDARRFLSRNPKSPMAVRVRAACLGSKK